MLNRHSKSSATVGVSDISLSLASNERKKQHSYRLFSLRALYGAAISLLNTVQAILNPKKRLFLLFLANLGWNSQKERQ